MVGSYLWRSRTCVLAGAVALLLSGVCKPQEKQPVPQFNLNVVVKEADTGQAISQARLTITFKSGKLHHPISYGAKTNAQGMYRFTNIPKGTIRLLVTAEGHQSYGKEIELEEDNQVIEVKLKKPQPQL